MNETERLVDLLVEVSDQIKGIYALVQEAHGYQWQTPRRVVAPEPEDAGTHKTSYGGATRQAGVISDPVSRTVVDDARMGLRAALVETERLVTASSAMLVQAHQELDQGLQPYQTA